MKSIKWFLPLALSLLILASCAAAPAETAPQTAVARPEQAAEVSPAAPVSSENTPAETVSAPPASAAPTETLPAETAQQTAVARPEPVTEVSPAAPDPVPPENTPTDAAAPLTCTLSISCASLLDHWDELDEGVQALVPADGWLLSAVETEFTAGEAIFDVLSRVCREAGIHLEFVSTPLYNSSYIEGIGNLYEFDCGPLSGWLYRVNGAFPGYGYSQYTLSDGDSIAVVYTCDLGEDIGGGGFA